MNVGCEILLLVLAATPLKFFCLNLENKSKERKGRLCRKETHMIVKISAIAILETAWSFIVSAVSLPAFRAPEPTNII
jgi:hypothetical protein